MTTEKAKSGNREARGAPSGAPSPPVSEIQQAWIDLLGRYQWEWFCTMTFRTEVHPEAANKRFRVWVSMINRELFGHRWYKHDDGIHWARALELQRRGVIHYHALAGGIGLDELRRLSWMDRWDKLAGYARIEAISNQDAVRNYVSKYTVKGGEIDLGGPLAKLRFPFAQPLLAVPLAPNGRDSGNPGREDRDTASRYASVGPSQIPQGVPGGVHLTGHVKSPGIPLVLVEIEPPQGSLFAETLQGDSVSAEQSALSLIPVRQGPGRVPRRA